MSGEIKLSVCIATYNRAPFIGQTLESVLKQCTPAVEVLVLDGASTDNTTEVIERYSSFNENLRYVKMNVNSGVDRDFDNAVVLARGRYCWLMSDDDFILPGGISSVLRAIEQNHALIVANAEVRNADMSAILQQRRLALAEDRVYASSDMDGLFACVGDYLTFIGGVILKRSLWIARDRNAYFGSLFIHVGVIFQAPLPDSALVIASPLVSIRYGNAMWRPRQFEIWMFMWPSLVWQLRGVSNEAKREVCSMAPWRSPKSLLLYRGRGVYSIVQYRELLRPRLESPWSRILPLAIALLPGMVINLLGLAYYRLAPGETGMGLLDMRNSPFYLGSRWLPWRRGASV